MSQNETQNETMGFAKISITQDYAFCKVMEDNPEICRELVQLIIGDEVGPLKLVQKQKQVDVTPDGRGIRLDVFCEDQNAVYNIEMQTTQQKDLGRRARFYQSVIDSDLLNKGQEYQKLPPSYVIFISPKDLIGIGEELCVFEMMSKDFPEADLMTETKIITVCAVEKGLARKDALGHFLRYLVEHVPTDEFTEKVDEAVERASMDADWRKAVYTWEMKLKDEKYYAKEEGKIEGKIEGLEEGLEIGAKETLFSLVKKGRLSIQEAAEELKMSEEDFKKIYLEKNRTV